MTFYIRIFTLSEGFKCNILPQHEVTCDINIGLTVHRKEGSKDASLHFTRTKLIYSNAWSMQAGDMLCYTGRVTLYYWQNSRSSFITASCCKINKEYNKMRSITPKKAKPQIIDPDHLFPLIGREQIGHVGSRCEKYDLLPTREWTMQNFCFHFFWGYGKASLATQWEIALWFFFAKLLPLPFGLQFLYVKCYIYSSTC